MKFREVIVKPIVEIQCIAPDEELRKVGEVYAVLRKQIEIPFVPFVGLRLMLTPRVYKGKRYDKWSKIVTVTGVIDIQKVCYDVDDRWMVVSTNVFFPTIEEFRAGIHLYKLCYGFERFT